MQNDKPSETLPDKLYFKIGEASSIVGLPSYVLRFWETEFKKINPKRTSSGQRLYRKSDIELIVIIKHLLYDKKFTIQGAKKYLYNTKKNKTGRIRARVLNEIRTELESIREILSPDKSGKK